MLEAQAQIDADSDCVGFRWLENLLSIPEFSLEEYQRPENNLFLSGKQQDTDDWTKLC